MAGTTNSTTRIGRVIDMTVKRDVLQVLIAPVLFCLVSMLPALVSAAMFGWNPIYQFVVFAVTFTILMAFYFLKDDS